MQKLNGLGYRDNKIENEKNKISTTLYKTWTEISFKSVLNVFREWEQKTVRNASCFNSIYFFFVFFCINVEKKLVVTVYI